MTLKAHRLANSPRRLRVASYNIHKGVRGVGPRKRLEIHNLKEGIESLDADVVCLQEVRLFHHRQARHFASAGQHWPEEGQAEYWHPKGMTWRTGPMPSRDMASMETPCCLVGRWGPSRIMT